MGPTGWLAPRVGAADSTRSVALKTSAAATTRSASTPRETRSVWSGRRPGGLGAMGLLVGADAEPADVGACLAPEPGNAAHLRVEQRAPGELPERCRRGWRLEERDLRAARATGVASQHRRGQLDIGRVSDAVSRQVRIGAEAN